jgi:hypothetical protein
MKICVTLGAISDVIGVQSEPPLHTGVQGVLGGEGKSAYKHVMSSSHVHKISYKTNDSSFFVREKLVKHGAFLWIAAF